MESRGNWKDRDGVSAAEEAATWPRTTPFWRTSERSLRNGSKTTNRSANSRRDRAWRGARRSSGFGGRRWPWNSPVSGEGSGEELRLNRKRSVLFVTDWIGMLQKKTQKEEFVRVYFPLSTTLCPRSCTRNVSFR